MEKRVLVAEDDDFMRDLYTDILSAEGYQVESAIDGEDALNKLSQGGWDLVLMDIIMPKLSGLDVVKKFKEMPQPQNPNKNIVFLTNLDKGEEIKEALSLGNGYIIKSQITPGDLIKETQKYLNPSTPQQEN